MAESDTHISGIRLSTSLTTAYWGRDGSAAAAAAAASSQLFGSPFGAAAAGLSLIPGATGVAGTSGGGGGSGSGAGGSGSAGGGSGSSNAGANDRYSSMANHQHHQNTMAVAASQAASLAGLHPASKCLLRRNFCTRVAHYLGHRTD